MRAPKDKVFVVDDDPVMRKSLSRLLRSAGFEAVEYGVAEDFLRSVPPDSSGCAVLDVSMPGLDGLALQRELSSRGSPISVVFLTGHGDIPKTVRAMQSGATDFLTKPVEDEVLLQAVRRALEANRALEEAREDRADVERRLATLTPREREVLELVVAGRLNKQIGADLGIAERTVKVHRGRVMGKMKVGSVAELVRLADRSRLPRSGA
jgi:RNA polymerase sigma factor (sigma-70 family)